MSDFKPKCLQIITANDTTSKADIAQQFWLKSFKTICPWGENWEEIQLTLHSPYEVTSQEQDGHDLVPSTKIFSPNGAIYERL